MSNLILIVSLFLLYYRFVYLLNKKECGKNVVFFPLIDFKIAFDDVFSVLKNHKNLEFLMKLLGRYNYVSDGSDIDWRQSTVFFLLFLSDAVIEVDLCLQNCFAYSNDFTAEDVVKEMTEIWRTQETNGI